MKLTVSSAALAIFLAAGAPAANAQAFPPGVNLTGQWQCVAQCVGAPGGYAFITQAGWEISIVNNAGQASPAWVDYPGHIWVKWANQGAIYSPDGMTLQFDNGTVWQHSPQWVVELVPPHPR